MSKSLLQSRVIFIVDDVDTKCQHEIRQLNPFLHVDLQKDDIDFGDANGENDVDGDDGDDDGDDVDDDDDDVPEDR